MSATLTPLSEFDTDFPTPYHSGIRNVLFCSFSRFEELSRYSQLLPFETRPRIIGRIYLDHFTAYFINEYGRIEQYKVEDDNNE